MRTKFFTAIVLLISTFNLFAQDFNLYGYGNGNGFNSREFIRDNKVFIVSTQHDFFDSAGGLAHATEGLIRLYASLGFEVVAIFPHSDVIEKNAKDLFKPTGKELLIELNKEGDFYLNKEKVRIRKYEQELDDIAATVTKLSIEHIPAKNVKNLFDTSLSGEEEAFSYGFFSKAVSRYIQSLSKSDMPSFVILNDWMVGLTAPFIKELKENELTRPANERINYPQVLGIIHNLLFQGNVSMDMFGRLGLKPEYMHENGHNNVEFHGHLSFMKAMIIYSDHINAVSPKYMEEIMTQMYGFGMHEIIKEKFEKGQATGIMNGADTVKWDPAKLLLSKTEGKRSLQEQYFGKADDDMLLIAMTNRVTQQKGTEYLIEYNGKPGVLDILVKDENFKGQFLIMGDPGGSDDDRAAWKKIKELSLKYPHKLHLLDKFNKELEAPFIGYADAFSNVSWTEPCGMNQLYAILYGSVNLLTNVGGLSTSIRNDVSGLLADIDISKDGKVNLLGTRDSIVDMYQKISNIYQNDRPKFESMVKRTREIEVSWEARSSEYLALLIYIQNRSENFTPRIKTVNPRGLMEQANPSISLCRGGFASWP